jgi:hypothetical protein
MARTHSQPAIAPNSQHYMTPNTKSNAKNWAVPGELSEQSTRQNNFRPEVYSRTALNDVSEQDSLDRELLGSHPQSEERDPGL